MRVFVTSIVSKWYESRPAGAERAGTANPPTVSRLRDHPGVAMRSVFAFALLSACSLPAVAQTAGSMLLQAGVINAVTLDDSTPLHTTVKPGPGALIGIPQSFDSPGTSATAGDATTLQVALSYFVTKDRKSVVEGKGVSVRVDLGG